MTDPIKSLPETKDIISPEEANIMREIFQAGQASVHNSYNILLYGVLFFVLSLPITDKLIKGFIGTTDLILLALKAVIFIFLIFILQLFGF